MSEPQKIKVWDVLVRFFHWSLVSAFVIAYFTEDELMNVHSWAGYFIFGLLVLRLLWGFMGTRYARFSDFIYAPKVILQFLKETLNFRAKRYLGHNPVGGAMIIALMLSLFLTTLTGFLFFDVIDPDQTSSFVLDALEESHELFANFTMLLVFIHVVGVVVESYIHRENLVVSMIDGFKRNIKSDAGGE